MVREGHSDPIEKEERSAAARFGLRAAMDVAVNWSGDSRNMG
jgi:hypothetical protein